MKTFFNSSELAHIWANLTPAEIAANREGRCPAHMSFRGAAFLSYGTVIARHITGKGKRPGVLLNVTRYSNTTTAHLARVRGALPAGLPVFEVDRGVYGDDLKPFPQRVFDGLVARAVDAVTQARRARSRSPWLLEQADAWLASANAAREFFGLRCKPAELGKALAAGHAAAARQAKRERAASKRRKEHAEHAAAGCARLAPQVLKLWREHDEDFTAGSHPVVTELRSLGYYAPGNFIAERCLTHSEGFQGNAALRLSPDGTRVETSQGAQVLTRTVAFLWAFCAKARATATAVAPEVIGRFPRLDYYTCRSIDSMGNLVAGCHRISFAEIEGIANALALPPFGHEDAATCSPEIPATTEHELATAGGGEVVG